MRGGGGNLAATRNTPPQSLQRSNYRIIIAAQGIVICCKTSSSPEQHRAQTGSANSLFPNEPSPCCAVIRTNCPLLSSNQEGKTPLCSNC